MIFKNKKSALSNMAMVILLLATSVFVLDAQNTKPYKIGFWWEYTVKTFKLFDSRDSGLDIKTSRVPISQLLPNTNRASTDSIPLSQYDYT